MSYSANSLATVYAITNSVNGKEYVGVTRFKPENRWTQHRYNATRGVKTALYSAIRKYGPDKFTVRAVATCLGNWDAVEQDVISAMQPAYNMTNGGEITKGRRIPAETIARIRAKNKGQKRTAAQNQANSARKKVEIASNPEYKAKIVACLRKADATRYLWEPKRLESLKKAGQEGRMSHKLTEERKAQQLANINTPEARAKSAASKCKPIVCVTTGEKYPSLLDAAAATGLHFTGISKVCLGKRKAIHGIVFRYV